MSTPNLALPEPPNAILNSGASLRAGFLTIDALLQSAVVSRVVSTPPSNAQQGERWIVPSDAGGAWLNRTNHIAYRGPAGWLFLVPRPGWLVWSIADSAFYVFSNGAWSALSAAGGGGDPLEVYEHFTDFDFDDPGPNGYVLYGESDGASDQPGETNRPGIMRLPKGAFSTTDNNLYCKSPAPLYIGGNEISFETDVRLSLAQATNSSETGVRLRVGLMEGISGNPTHMIGFTTHPSDNSGMWSCSAVDSSNATTINTSFAHAAGDWTRFKFVLAAGGAQVEFFINGTSMGTIASNIPIGRSIAWRWQIWQAAGYSNSGAVNMDVDWVRVRQIGLVR